MQGRRTHYKLLHLCRKGSVALRRSFYLEYNYPSMKAELLQAGDRRELRRKSKDPRRMVKNLSGKTAIVTGSSRYD